MKRYILTILLAIAYTLINGSDPSMAAHERDEWECLFCHQYPGLVIPEQPDGYRIVSIDKETHFRSPHGNVPCVQCHTQVRKVPHAGATSIECTNGCHTEDRADIEAMDLASYRVHRDEQCSVSRLKDESSCMVCHSFYPHSKNQKVRAILNMHTGYLVCDPCHLKKETMKGMTSDWKGPDSAEFTGRPYGRHSGDETERDREKESLFSRILRPLTSRERVSGKNGGPGYMLTRIAVFSLKGGEKKLFMNTLDCGRAYEYQEREKVLTADEKKKELHYFHRDIATKEFTVACNGCHSSTSMLDFKKLGYDEKTSGYLKELDVKRLETEYDIFYFPHMLKR